MRDDQLDRASHIGYYTDCCTHHKARIDPREARELLPRKLGELSPIGIVLSRSIGVLLLARPPRQRAVFVHTDRRPSSSSSSPFVPRAKEEASPRASRPVLTRGPCNDLIERWATRSGRRDDDAVGRRRCCCAAGLDQATSLAPCAQTRRQLRYWRGTLPAARARPRGSLRASTSGVAGGQ